MEHKQMPSIIHSEKINRKSTYKNKFQQFQEQQNRQFLQGHITSPPMPQLQTISHGHTGPGSQQMSRIRSTAKKSYQQSAKKVNDYWQNEAQTPGYGSLDDQHNQLGESIQGSFDATKAVALKTIGGTGLNQSPPRKQTPLYSQINTIQPKKGDYSYLSENQEGAAQVSKFRQNQNAYAINLGQKSYNKKVKNLNDQLSGKQAKPGGKGYQKNFKEDLITFQQNQQLQKTLLKVQSNDSEHTRLNNNSIDKLPKGVNGKVFRTNQTSSYQQSRLSKTVKKDNQSFKDNAVLSTGQTPEIQIMTPLKDVKFVSKYSITKKVGTANQDTRLKKQNVPGSKATSIFDTSTIDMSVKGPSRAGGRNKSSINPGNMNEKFKYTQDNGEENFMMREGANQLHPANNLGYVNYINGVPVSIQLNNTNDFISKAQEKSLLSDGGTIPNSAQPNSWKQNMIRRNDILNNNDVNKMHQRNEMEKQQFLPSIGQGGRPKKIKPNYYKNKRKQNYSNLYEGEYGHLGLNKNGPQENNNESIDLAIKKNFTASQAFSAKDGGVLQNMKSKQSVTKASGEDIRGDLSPDTGRRAESMYVPKRRKAKRTPSKSPPRSTSRKRSKKTFKNTTAATATDVEYKTPKQKLKRDEQLAGSTSKMMTSNKGSRKLIGASSFSKKSKDKNIKARAYSPLESNDKVTSLDDGGPVNLEIPASQRTRGDTTRGKKGQSVPATQQAMRSKYYQGVNIQKNFEKVPVDPSLFKIQVQRKHLEHLQKDDLDEISKFEVIYKILKDQLRTHQAKLIALKKEHSKKKKQDNSKSPFLDRNSTAFKEFAKHVKPFEWYGAQRDLSPELKRIVKNLACQEHQYVYCPCCKEYDDGNFDPLENINKFMKFIKEEQDKINPPPKKSMTKTTRPRVMEDDSVSEITDLDYEDVLHTYYSKKIDSIAKRRAEREASRRRLQGQPRKSDKYEHKCRANAKQMAKMVKGEGDALIEMELRQRSEGKSMQDEEHSAHQFSIKEQSVQADSEERLEAEMQASNMDNASPMARSIVNKSLTRSQTNKSVVLMSQASSRKQIPAAKMPKLKRQETLFSTDKTKVSMAVQTDDDRSKMASRIGTGSRGASRQKTIRKQDTVVRKEDSSVQFTSSHESRGTLLKNKLNPDAYKEDWIDSLVFKRAMKAEAIKRGLRVDSDWEVDEEEERVAMTNADAVTMQGDNENENASASHDHDEFADQANAQDPDFCAHHGTKHGLGFLKQALDKGNIRMLSENEVQYIKTLLKQDTDKWEHSSTLADLYRHCKYTIRFLTRQMANIDNAQIFRKNRIPNRDNTLFMVYRAERLYSALGDATKVCKHLAAHLFDQEEFDLISNKENNVNKDDEKFVRKRELLIKRIQAQVNIFLQQYTVFGDRYQFKQQHMKNYLKVELAKTKEVRRLFDQNRHLQSNDMSAISSRVGHESNNKEIITIPEPVPPTPPPRIPGPTSPYYSKVPMPDQVSSSRNSKDSRLRSSKESKSLRESQRQKKMKLTMDGVMRASKVSGNILEEDREMRRSLQHMKDQYAKLQDNNGLNKEKNLSRDIDSSAHNEGQTVRTYGNNQVGSSRYAASQKDPMMEQNPMVDDDDYNDGTNQRPAGVAVPPLGINESLEGRTEYTQMTKGNAKQSANIKDQSTQVYQKRVSPTRVLLEQKGKIVTPRVPQNQQL